MIALSLVGISIGFISFRHDKREIRYHIENMIGAGIGIHTALLVGGGNKLLPSFLTNLGWYSWVLPSVIGIVASKLITKKFNKNN